MKDGRIANNGIAKLRATAHSAVGTQSLWRAGSGGAVSQSDSLSARVSPSAGSPGCSNPESAREVIPLGQLKAVPRLPAGQFRAATIVSPNVPRSTVSAAWAAVARTSALTKTAREQPRELICSDFWSTRNAGAEDRQDSQRPRSRAQPRQRR